MDELKQKLGLVPQITTEETFGDYSYYEFNGVDILNGTRKKRVNILIKLIKQEKIKSLQQYPEIRPRLCPENMA